MKKTMKKGGGRDNEGERGGDNEGERSGGRE